MPDWTKSMKQSFEYYEVDPVTWTDKSLLGYVRSCSITRDIASDTLGNASFEIDSDFTEMYVRVYLITIQNGVRERFPLGTFLLQSPRSKYTDTLKSVEVDAYTPLLELKEQKPPVGYFVPKDTEIIPTAVHLLDENTRCPVGNASNSKTLESDFVSHTNDTWFTFLRDLLSVANHNLDLDEYGRILLKPVSIYTSAGARWTFNNDDVSIIYSDITIDHDLFGVPNVVEIVASNGKETKSHIVVNDDINSPTSTINRGRRIVYRETNPKSIGVITQGSVEAYARRKLEELSTISKTISYTHAYCPVTVGDTIRINNDRYGLNNITAQIISQDIDCVPGTPVSETAIYTEKLWRG